MSSATPQGRWPTGTVSVTIIAAILKIETRFARPLAKYAVIPSCERATPVGFVLSPTGTVLSGTSLGRSTTVIEPPCSDVTTALEPSRAKTTNRGRAPTGNSPRCFPVLASITVTVLELSFVT